MYKARLTSAATSSESAAPTAQVTDVLWQSVRIGDTRSEAPAYEVEIEVPAFVASDLTELNQIEQGWAQECVQSFRRLTLSEIKPFLPLIDWTPPAGYLSGTFAVTHFDESAISLRYAMSEYHYGAAHGHAWFRTITALRSPLVVFHFEDLFDDSSDFVQRIASFATDNLLRTHESLDVEWVRKGAGPEIGNFRHFNISEEGVVITFPPYHVAAWADGPQQVTIPWHLIRDIMNPRLALSL
jgi:hypothetical protein